MDSNDVSNQSIVVDPRIYLATERTFLAWIRTAVAFMAFGFVVARFGVFLRQLAFASSPTSVFRSGLSMKVGLGLIGLGAMTPIVAAFRHKKLVKAIDENKFKSAFNSDFTLFFAGAMVVAGVFLTWILIEV